MSHLDCNRQVSNLRYCILPPSCFTVNRPHTTLVAFIINKCPELWKPNPLSLGLNLRFSCSHSPLHDALLFSSICPGWFNVSVWGCELYFRLFLHWYAMITIMVGIPMACILGCYVQSLACRHVSYYKYITKNTPQTRFAERLIDYRGESAAMGHFSVSIFFGQVDSEE